MAATSKLLARAVRVAFRAGGDQVEKITWRQLNVGAYDVATGRPAIGNVDTQVDAIQERLSSKQAAAAGVSDKGIRLIVQGEALAPIIPKQDDRLIHRGITYVVKDITWHAYPAAAIVTADI